MKIILFGYQLDITAGPEYPLTFEGKTIANVSSDTRSWLTIVFIHPFELLDSNYQFNVSIGTEAKIDLLQPDSSSIKGSVSFKSWGKAVGEIKPALENGIVYFKARSEDLNSYIKSNYLQNTFSTFYDNIRGQAGPITNFFKGFAPDLTTKAVELILENYDFDIQEILGTMMYNQRITGYKLVLSPGLVELVIRPSNGIIYLHPDILNNFDQGKENIEQIFIQYQMALVNGELSYKFDAAGKNLFWKSDKFQVMDTAVALLKYADENGNPICISSKNDSIPILYRDGNMKLLLANSDFNNQEYQKTIRGITVGALSGKLKTIDFASIDFEKREKQLYGLNWDRNTQKELLAHPFWLYNNGGKKEVRLLSEAPQMIMGLTRGAWLTNKTPGKPVSITLSMTPVPIKQTKFPNVYHLHQLSLNNTDWILHSAYEEKESKALSTTDSLPAIQSRMFSPPPSLDAGTFDIPATDFHFAATNVYHPKTLLNTTDLKETAIQKSVMSKLKDMNDVFQKFAFVPEDQEHVSKFRRLYNKDVDHTE